MIRTQTGEFPSVIKKQRIFWTNTTRISNRTSEYLCKWKNNQRLKKNSPFSLANKMKIISQSVEHTSLRPCVNPVEGLPGVYFHTELLSHTNKTSIVPEYLQKLDLEVINGA
ncbi:RNase H domain-containing protein [Trichonephila clavipes]|nr:RNase H domain-containing protein [Trichonephila clavipes]